MNILSPLRVIQFLKTIPLFQEVPDEDLLQLVPHCLYRCHERGHPFFWEGDSGDWMILILSGRITIERVTERQTIFIAEREAGDYIGELALIDGKPRSANAVASERVEFLRLERSAFLDWVHSHPKAMWVLVQTVTGRLRETLEALEGAIDKDAMGRLSHCLLTLSSRGTCLPNNHIALERITQERLAERIYSDRATVNRLLSSLEQINAIERDGRQIILKDIGRLRRLCDQ